MACVKCPASGRYFWKKDFRKGDKCENHNVELILYSMECPVVKHPNFSWRDWEYKKI